MGFVSEQYASRIWRMLAYLAIECGRASHCFGKARQIQAADFLRENSRTDERVVVLGSEPEIYFYSRRQSATGFIYMYPLAEQQRFALRMQRQMIEEVEKNRPAFVVWVWTPMSWRVAA